MSNNNEKSEPGSHRSLANKTVVFVACGSDLNKFTIYEAFYHEHKMNILLVEAPDNVLANRLQAHGIVTHVKIDMAARPSLIDDIANEINSSLKSMNKEENDVDGIVTFWDDAVALCARLAVRYGTTTSPPSAMDICHDKYATREALMKSGLPYPLYRMFNGSDDVEAVVEGLKFPLVLKPVQGATSIGVYVCNDMNELKQNIVEGRRVVQGTYEVDELMGLVFADSPASCVKDPQDLISFVIEEFIDGPEVDIDMIVSDGKVVYAKVSDDWEPEEKWRTETGVNYPSRLPQNMHEDFIAASTSVVQAFGVTHGVLHIEMKYSSRHGPMLIECNPRLGGGPCHYFHKHLYGVDLAVEQVMIATGQGSNPNAKTPTTWGVGLLLYALESGTIAKDVDQTEEFSRCLDAEFVVNLSMPLKEGDHVFGWNSPDFPSHAGLLMCSIPRDQMSIDDACEYASNLRNIALAGIKLVQD